MSREVRIDFITFDPSSTEWALYLVEEGPWQLDQTEHRLRDLQSRILDAVDVAIDGHLRSKYPDSVGQLVRIQVDSHGGAPVEVEEMVVRLNEVVAESDEYQADLAEKGFIKALRIVTLAQMGRS
jgi:hypothetical protein